MLAILTAFVAVSALSIPVFFKTFHIPKSNAMLDQPTFDGTTLRLVAINKGDAPASIGSTYVESELLAGATRVKLRDDSSALIRPGNQQVTFDIIPLLSADQAYKQSIDALGKVIDKKGFDIAATIRIDIIQSDGHVLEFKIPIRQANLFYILRSDADRCDGIKAPNFENGCIGPGEER